VMPNGFVNEKDNAMYDYRAAWFTGLVEVVYFNREVGIESLTLHFIGWGIPYEGPCRNRSWSGNS
jgi:hypothetical protein